MRFVLLLTISLLSFTVSAQLNITWVSSLPYSQLSSLWGYTAPDNTEYALVGAYNGLSIVSLADPAAPEELFFVEGAESAWREVKTFGHYAYVTNETGGGLLIVDLQDLPGAIDTVSYAGTADHPFTTAHTLFVDENGILYLFGYNVVFGLTGAYMLDLNTDPMNPDFVAVYEDHYIHDAFVRNDTMWAAEIYDGRFEVLDISDKTSFLSLGYAETYGVATHNCEPDANGNILFTTDEIFNGYITSFDISDLTDIQELDRYKHGDTALAIPHNVRVLGDFLVASHYSEGVVILDASRPGLLVETGHYDTNPAGPDAFFEGAWEVYPYLPSGLLIVSDIQEGLQVLQPEYVYAAFLEGVVTDEVTGASIPLATIELTGTTATAQADLLGQFELGYHSAGIYDVSVSAPGCSTRVFADVELENGVTAILDAALDCGTVALPAVPDCSGWLAGTDHSTGSVWIQNYCTESNTTCTMTDLNGRMIWSGSVSGTDRYQIPVTTPPGIYFLADQLGQTRSVTVMH